MTLKKLLLAGSIAAIAAAIVAVTVRFNNVPGRTSHAGSRAMDSTVLGERRHYRVFLPDEYHTQPTARFPVLYVLDSELQEEQALRESATLSRIGITPPLIVVGIPAGDAATRSRDFTPPQKWVQTTTASRANGDSTSRFTAFLQHELIPKIESEHRTARPRIIAGSSLSGLYVLYNLIAAPQMFDTRLALSPFIWSEEDQRAVERFAKGVETLDKHQGFLYISIGDGEDQTVAHFRQLVRKLETLAPPYLRWRADLIKGGTHETSPSLSTPVGLCAAFAPDARQACRPRQL